MVQCYCGCRSVLCACVPALLLLTYRAVSSYVYYVSMRTGLTVGWFPLLLLLCLGCHWDVCDGDVAKKMLEEEAEGEDL